MDIFSKLLHLAAAIVWLGGMTFMLWALRPVALAQLAPPLRIPLLTGVMVRFFMLVWACIVVILVTGLFAIAAVGMKAAPIGWHLMLGLGLLMMAIFGHLFFGPFRRLKAASARADWPAAGQQLARMHPWVLGNCILGWIAVAAVLLLR
ncbi:hypothetical protein RD110_02695 [Rhodoferax koreense]|uniref:Copper resistance protein D domain-containing protein n=1 Tax=Rhodoferax koreensis TaxID=1842727 RepID=A0A1P8JR72_9BURK|nr:CopD family protein [Rhodoferax koreense]APW36253.1 hypothetical protein RD110_02695 [Rhodoferax koreense]